MYETLGAVRNLAKVVTKDHKKAKPANHGDRTVRLLEKMGFTTIVKVEHEQAHANKKKDLLACDYLAVRTPGLHKPSLTLVQVCSKGSATARLKKMAFEKGLTEWIQAGGEVAALAWEKKLTAGGAVKWVSHWTPCTVESMEALRRAAT